MSEPTAKKALEQAEQRLSEALEALTIRSRELHLALHHTGLMENCEDILCLDARAVLAQ